MFGIPRTTAYSASKHALHGYFEALRNEFKLHNGPEKDISVGIIPLGPIATDIALEKSEGILDVPLGWYPPIEAARAIIWTSQNRYNWNYYPYLPLRSQLFVYVFSPSLCDFLLRMVTV